MTPSEQLRRLVDQAVADELLAIGAEMSEAADLIKAGAHNRRRNHGCSQREYDQRLDLAEAFRHTVAACTRHAQIRAGRWRPVRRRAAEPAALFDLEAST